MAYGVTGRPQRKKKAKCSSRTIICLPLQWTGLSQADAIELEEKLKGMHIKIPRGKSRQKLSELGPVARIAIQHSWNEQQTTNEVSDLFQESFGAGFSFMYLSMLYGAKALIKPKVSKNFSWHGQAVLSLNRSTIYILSSIAHKDTTIMDFEGTSKVCLS